MAAGTLKLAGQGVPEHCLVSGKQGQRTSTVDGQSYAIGFEMRRPKAWDGRFWHQGIGGVDGNVVTATGSFGGGPTTHALLQGVAVLSPDARHLAAQGSAFGIDPQARLDDGDQAVAKRTPIAKSVIQTAYGRVPDRSNFGGRSNGGRHTLVTAARLSDDDGGYLAGAPGCNLPTAFTTAERKTLAAAVLAKCDALDGATDGLIQDTAACQVAFNFNTDVPTCSGARDGSCLSATQKAAIGPTSGGLATDQFDAVTALVAWVEKGVAPQALVATARGTGNAGGVTADLPTDWAANRSRPLCPCPQVARYSGAGSLEVAASFSSAANPHSSRPALSSLLVS